MVDDAVESAPVASAALAGVLVDADDALRSASTGA